MKTQAMGWLAAAVVAAGLNASYHQGGMEWAHQIADQVGHNTEAVIALATGRADRFLAEAQVAKAEDEDQTEVSSCRLQTALARVQTRIARSEARFASLDDVMSAREQAQAARIDAQRARIEARVEARVARIRIPAVAVNPVVVRVPQVDVCPRIRVNVPRLPVIRVPATPVIHIDVPGAGPV